jgi:hypothetical protein
MKLVFSNYNIHTKISFINSIPTAPTTIAVVVAIAGIIFPAINFILNLSPSGIL